MKSLLGSYGCAVLVLAAVVHGDAIAQDGSAKPMQDVPVIDGSIEDPEWSGATEIADLPAPIGSAAGPGGGRTLVRALFDEDAIYLAARMTALDAGPGEGGSAREQASGADWLIATFDGDEGTGLALVFGVNGDGVARSTLVVGDEVHERPAAASWEVSTARTEDGWSAEFRIPFAELTFGDGTGAQVVGMSFERRIATVGDVTGSGSEPIGPMAERS